MTRQQTDDAKTDLPRVVRAYDAAAEAHFDTLATELESKPYDRARLDVIVGSALRDRPALDVGCGAGQVATYLADSGLEVIGIDASAQMIVRARRRQPNIDFYTMDLRSLTFADATFGALVARYALVHLPRESLPNVLDELARVLAPKAPLLITLYDGEGEAELPPIEAVGSDETLAATLYKRSEVAEILQAHDGFEDVRVEGRRPYKSEAPFFRIFVTAARRA